MGDAKKSKKKIIIIIVIIVLVVFFILPPALAFILLFDSGKMKVDYDENFSTEKWGESLVADSLDKTVSDEIIQFSATEKDINNMLYSSYKDNAEMKEFLNQIALDIREKSYVFSLSAKLGFFQTRIKISASLDKMEMTKGSRTEDAYVFTLKGASIGRISNLKGAVISILKNAFGDNGAADMGVTINTDFDNSRVYIFASDLRKIINDAIPSEGGKANFYLSFINDFLDKNLVEIDFYGNESITIKVKLHDLTGNDYGSGQYVYYGVPYGSTTTKLTIDGQQRTLSLDVIRDALVSLLDDGLITTSQMNSVSDYLFNGYNGSNAPSCSLESIGITSKETYQGFNLNAGVSLDNIVSNGITNFSSYDISLNQFQLASFTESDVNAYLKAQGILGNKFFLTGENAEGGNKASYIALDNVYLNFTDDSAVVSVGLNLNGLETTMTLPMTSVPATGAKLVYQIENAYYGATDGEGNRLESSEDTKALIFDTLHNMASSDSFSFSEDGRLTIDFSQVITQATNSVADGPYKTFLSENATYSVDVDGANITDNAVLKIMANRN